MEFAYFNRASTHSATAQPNENYVDTVDPQSQVLLSEELQGSLRGLKASSTLARDRFKSLQRRGVIEPRTQAQKSGGKRKELERFGNRDGR